jgi:hypothetical protein
MNVPGVAAMSLAGCLGGCLLLPDFTHWNGYVNHAELAGRSRAEVLAELGPPAALRADGSAFLYALPDNDWICVVGAFFVGVVVPLDPHWDVRFVGFDQRGIVQVATPTRECEVSLDELVRELIVGNWRR